MPEAEAAAGGTPDRRARTPAIWIFLSLDCASFGLFFIVFMAERMAQPALFDASAQQLDARLGFLNACILITSSWLVAWATRVGLAGQIPQARRLLMAALAVGACFGVVKVLEYAQKIGAGLTIAANDFFMFYFALTGIHLVHYLVGMVVLAILAAGPGNTGPQAARDARYRGWLVGGGLYWHMVDLLWIFIFSLLYLVGAR